MFQISKAYLDIGRNTFKDKFYDCANELSILKLLSLPQHLHHLTHKKAQYLVTSTHVVALEDHGGIVKVELAAQPSVAIVPVLTRNLTALARIGRAAAAEESPL